MMRVRVLGELRLELDGQPLPLPSRRPARALLGWLALHPGVHHRAKVAARLWPNVRDDSARVSLRSALAALRSAMGPAAERALIATRAELGLAEPDVWVDVREFERRLAADQVEAALELCGGELLADFDEDWVLTARDEHRARESEALGVLADRAVGGGDHPTAIGLARRRAALDPFDESAHRELIGLLLSVGDRGAAVATYQRLADRLRRELGVAPSPATRAVLATPIPARTLTDPATPDVTPRPALPVRVASAPGSEPLVGRNRELARLGELWARSRSDAPQLAFVTGEPGIGKTRLVSEFAVGLEGDGVRVLYGAAREEGLVPYEPFVDCMREPLREQLQLPEEAAALAGLIPELSTVEQRAHPLGDPGPGARLRLFEAFGQAMDTIAGDRPLLLIVEDLHWADAPTIRLLVHLAARSSRSRRALIVTYRDTDVDEHHPLVAGLADLHRALPVEAMALEGIDTDAVAAIVRRAHAGAFSPDSAPALREHTGGNPFFIEELLRGGAQLAGAQPPAAVGHVVSRRVVALGEAAQPILAVAAVAGTEFELSLLAEALDQPVSAVLDVLDAAQRARLVTDASGGRGGYAFVHAIVRDTLAGALTAGRRAHIHDLIAQILERRAESDPDRYLLAAARHALDAAAGTIDPERVATLAQRAADRAAAVLAHEDAAELLRRAAVVLERRGGASGRRAELIAQAALARGGVGVTILGANPELVAELEQALDALGPAHPELRARLLARLAIEINYEPDSSRRESLSAEALQLAGRIDDPRALAAALQARHVSLWGPDHSRERKELADEMLELAERASDRELALQARHWRIVDLFELGEGQAVRDELDTYAALAAELRLPAYSWYVPMWRATIALLEGRIAEGADLARRARELGRIARDRNADVFFAEQQLLRHLVTGTLDELDPATGGVQGEVAERAQRGPAWRAYHFTFAWLHAERDEAERARRDFDAALADGFETLPRDVNWLDTMGAAANAAVLLGDTERCSELRALLEPYADRMIVNARGALHVGSVAYVLARLADACGDDEAADQLFQNAAQRDERAGAPVWVNRDHRQHSEFLQTIGRGDRQPMEPPRKRPRARDCAGNRSRPR